MSSYYGLLLHDYWDRETGRRIADEGGADAQLLGCYVMANRRDNMIGLYRLPLAEIAVALSSRRLIAAMLVLQQVEFVAYDFATEFIWVREMARIRVGLRDRKAVLGAKDKRIPFINTFYARMDDNPFLLPFFKRYHRTLHLEEKRTSKLVHQVEPLGSPFQGPPKPEIRSDQIRNTDQKAVQSRDQDQGSAIRIRKSTGASRRPALAEINSSETPTVMGATGYAPAEGPSALVVSPALRDCEDGTRAGAGHRRLRVARTHQEPARRIGFSVSAASTPTHGGDGGGADGDGEALGAAAGADAGALAAEATLTAAADQAGGDGHSETARGAAAAGAVVDCADAGLDEPWRDRITQLDAHDPAAADPAAADRRVLDVDVATPPAAGPTLAELLQHTRAHVNALPPMARRRRGERS